MEIRDNNLNDLWMASVQICRDYGAKLDSRDGGSTELVNMTLVLSDIDSNFVIHPVRKASPVYANAELIWYLSGSDSVNMIKAYAPQYERFAEKSGYVHGAYGRRIVGSEEYGRRASKLFEIPPTQYIPTQIDSIIRILTTQPNSRQAVLSLWQDWDLPHAVTGDRKDLPCTLSVQFLIRQGKLHAIVNMRSNDLWLGTPYDIFCWSTIQRIIADSLGVGYGQYVHHVGSLHIYDRNMEKASQITTTITPDQLTHDYVPDKDAWHGTFEKLLLSSIEFDARKLRRRPVQAPGPNAILDAIFCTASKWLPGEEQNIHSPLLKKGMEVCRL